MAALLSSGASPGSGFSVPLDEDEETQSWRFLENLSAGAASFDGGSGEMLFTAGSPSIISQGSWNVVHNGGQPMRALTTPSPVMSQSANVLSTSPFSGVSTFGIAPPPQIDSGSSGMVFDFQNVALDPQQQASQQQTVHHQQQQQQQQQRHHHQQQQQQFNTQALLNEQVAAFAPQDFIFTPQEMLISGFDPGFGASFMLQDAGPFQTLNQQTPLTQSLDIPMSMQGAANVQPWDPTTVQHNGPFVAEHIATPPPRSDGSSISLSPRSPPSPPVKQEPRNVTKRTSSASIQNIPKKASGVQKTHKKKTTSPPRTSPDSSDTRLKDGILMFCNQTVDTWGKPNFTDMENIERSSQKGRKGALSEEVRANALRVRQTGACFCCHIRKVKCDEQRPCKNCVKVCTQVPEIVCWKFPDFAEILFPDLLRNHFQREETARFIEENVASFTVNGIDTPCRISLSSGVGFATKLVIMAKFFTARDVTSDINTHWYHFVGNQGIELERFQAAPIGLEIMDGAAGASQRSELRRKIEAYADSLVLEPNYAKQVTGSIRKTTIPFEILSIVQQYATKSSAAIVRRALSILGMHYVMTRQLLITQQSIANLQQMNPMTPTGPFLTSRLLNRQIKMVLDDIMQQEINTLFDEFTKRLKGKSRKQWAPCFAAFLVFCLLMEAIETAADTFVIARSEIELRNGRPPNFMRARALELNEEIENMPFKQFAIQFHNIFQTHPREATAKTFNPLFGEGLNELAADDPPALEMILALRNLIAMEWGQLDWLTCDPILPNIEDHPFPADTEEHYVGRLASKFLLSFERPSYIFASA